MTTHDIWTAEITAQATQRYNDGASILTIARELQALCGYEITKNMVSGKIKRLRRAGVEFTRAALSPIVTKNGKYRRHKPRRPKSPMQQQRIDNLLAAEAFAAVLEPLPDPVMLLVSLLDLTEHSCRWIVGTGRDAKYCGCQTARGSYCAAHYERAWRRAPELKPRQDNSQFVR